MERHRALDSSMSSLYSGSGMSNAASRQHEFSHQTSASNNHIPSSISPTPSTGLIGVGGSTTNVAANNSPGGASASAAATSAPGAGLNRSNGSVNGGGSGQGLRATTIGTVVLRCGPIQLVIALLQSPDKLHIKVVEMEPKITTLAESFDGALFMQQQHDETMRNLQDLPGPMDEFVQKADKLLASKRISSELVNAMAETLNDIWQDILHLLHDRQQILHLCTQFHDRMTHCNRRMNALEVACLETMRPADDVAGVQDFLNRFKQLRIDMLTAVMAALKDGNELLAQLQEIAKLETLDTRPDHIKRDATRAVHQVQQWLEALHDHRNALEIAWQTRKTQLEQCLALALLGRELDELIKALKTQRLEVSSSFSLGECEQSANNTLHNYRELKQQALLLRDRALKITRAKEKLQSGGSLTGDEACARAYNVLSGCTEHLDLVDQREHWLQQSRDFFAKAAKTLLVLEKLEVELSNVKLPPNSPQSFAMYAKVLSDMRGFTDEPLRLGYSILDEVGRTQAETQGVKRVLDEIENRKIYIESICAASNEERARVEQALSQFLEQYNDLLAWLMSSGQQYLQQHVDMGRNLQQSKQFLLQHHELMHDLEIKGELINLLLETIKKHLESLSPQQRYDVDSKAEALHKHWIELKDLVLKRVDCVSLLIEFFEKADRLASQLDNLDRQLHQTPDQQKLQFLHENWQSIKGDFNDLKSCGMRFTNMKIVDPYLDTKSSTAAVEDILDEFSKRQIDVTSSLENWTTHIEEKREVEVILERIMNENEETTVKTTKMDTQLYPVFSTASVDTEQLRGETRNKLSHVLQDIEKAQDEIQQRIHTTLAIQTKDDESLQKIEQVIGNLRTLKSKLDGIKYDYESLLEHVLSFLEGIAQLRSHIDAHFDRQQQQFESIDRIIVDHERFRDSCMDKFRSLIAQSELLIDRVRALEPPGVREIDTDRILKLLENLRVHFEAGNSERMLQLERLEKLEQFKCDLGDINRSLDSVSQQLNDINGQSIDSLAAAKTTSLAFEYFERTVENIMPNVVKLARQQNQLGPSQARSRLKLLEKRIERFAENTTQHLYSTNPESEAFVRDELRKLNEKWQHFKDQVKNKRSSLNQATKFFEDVEKIEAEYREISYFYTSISNKISYLRDPVEAANLVNDIEKYVGSRESPLRDKLDNAAHSAYDMQKLSALYNDVMSMFQSFVKLKAEIGVVNERLKNEERVREQREREAREKTQREQAAREAEAREKAAREEAARLQLLREQAAREQAQRERAAQELAARERAVREEEARLQAEREFTAREHAARERKARDEAARLQALREQAQREEEARLQALRDQARREEDARQKAAREQAERERTAREHEMREEAARLQRMHDEEIRLRALREQNQRDLEADRLRARREEESRLQALREEELRIQALRDQAKRDQEESHLKVVRDQIDHQRFVTENIRKDVQINEIFTEIKYTSPRFTQPLKDAITREGDKIVLECEVTGNPEPTVEWFKDGISIQSNSDYKTSYDKRRCQLVIEETFAADSAHFTCRASNLVGVSDTTASLSVRENVAEVQMIPPRIMRFLESGKAMEGKPFQFSCVVTGNPLPTVQWYKNDKCIDDSPDYIINYNNGEATLRFEEVFLEDDAVYTCSASNPAGIEHCSASLMVEPLEPTEIPHFKIPLSNAMGRVGQKIKLEALIGGIPRPEIHWTHNGKPFQPRGLKYDFGRITLLIPQAYPNDAGVYVLTAKNLAGEAFSSCNVIVKGRMPNETSDSEIASDMEPIKPSVQLPLKDISIFEGKPVRLDCVIVGQPEPEVIWYHNERPVKESADVQLLFQGDRCSLIIQEVYQEDEGQYKVVAINSAGEASSGCELKVTPLNIAEPATRTNAERQSVPKETQPKFEQFLSDVLVDEGESVQLEVIASGDQPLSAKWFLSNKELLADERISMVSTPESGVFRLLFKHVTAEDKGVYTVKVTNPAGDAKCFSQLIVKSVNTPENQRTQQVEIIDKHESPEFKELFSDRLAHAEDVVKFECIVKGKPTPKVHWYFNDQPVQGHNFLVSTSGERQVLTVQSMAPETVGKISCVAENEAGKANCVASLNLIDDRDSVKIQPPVACSDVQTTTQEHNTDSSLVTIKKQTFTTTSTSEVNSYEGNIPQTEIHQSSAHIDTSLKQVGLSDPEIVESRHYEEMHKEKDMSIPVVQKESLVLVQSGSSTSSVPDQAINSVPESPTRLRKQIAPRFTTPLTGKIVDQGSDVCMEAIYDGFPSPEIKVQRNGDPLVPSERLKITNQCNRVRIELKEVGIADAGRYSITACNTVGQSASTADLVVKKTIFPPVFGRRLQAQVVKRGEKVTMEVEVTGLPEPTITWWKDEKPIKEAGLSAYRLISLGNSHKLIIEKGQSTDSGKYMIRATNAGGEAKSIADCAILEPSPERMQEVVKTIVYETPLSSLKTENFAKEPSSFQTSQSEISTASDLHGLSESKIITEHRCTTEATMRLEHKSPNLILPELSQHHNKTLDAQNEAPQTVVKTADSGMDAIKSKTDSTQTPPQVAPKPVPLKIANGIVPTSINPIENTAIDSITKSSSSVEKYSSEKKSSTVEQFKTIDFEMKSIPTGADAMYPIYEIPTQRRHSAISSIQQSVISPTGAEVLQNLNLVPGSPPELCYEAKLEQPKTKPTFITDKIKKLEDAQQSCKEPPLGGVALLPHLPSTQTIKHESTFSKEIKLDYGSAPIVRAAACLPIPAQNFQRSSSPKPSAEGLAMEKLWTPTHLSGHEDSACNNFEYMPNQMESKCEQPKSMKTTKEYFEGKICEQDSQLRRLPTPTTELNAPYLVKQVSKAVPMATPPIKEYTPFTDGPQLEPGAPPEICFAPKQEERRQSVVETMEKTLEQNLKYGPSRVLPHSVPTISPQECKSFRPPPPLLRPQFGRGSGLEHYESDYESDRWKCSGSDSDETAFRGFRAHSNQGSQRPKSMDVGASVPTGIPSNLKVSGYAADTEDISNYRKMESMHESHYYESTSNKSQSQPQLVQQPPAQLLYQTQNGHEEQNYEEFRREQKDFMKTSSTTFSSTSYNSKTSGPKFQSTPIKPNGIPTVNRTPIKTPADYSDYSSEIDERFRSVSRTYDSDPDIKGYRVVYPPTPTPTPRTNVVNGHKSPVVVVTPSPMEFESMPPPSMNTFSRPKFEPIRKEIRQETKTEQKQYYNKMQQQQKPQTVFKPKPVAAKFLAAAQREPQQQPKTTMYYNAIAGTPLHTAKMATETKNIMQMKESSETCQRVVNMQQTKRIIHFDNQKEELNRCPTASPFPYSPSPSHMGGQSYRSACQMPPPSTPTKFVPGEFRDSEYDSEIEQAKIRPLWTPRGEHGDLRFRHVEPPHPSRSCSLPRTYERVLSPMEFDRGPEMPSKINVDVNTLRQERGKSLSNAHHNKGHSLNRHSSMRNTTNNNSYTSYNQRYQTMEQQENRNTNFPRDDMNLKVGSPPKYGYIQPYAEAHGKQMGSAFLQKSHQFIDDIDTDLRRTTTSTYDNSNNLVNGVGSGEAQPVMTHAFRPGFKRAPSEGDRPQAYRDESRVSQYGTKCVDPNTGLIYFKYDFGYEFGILFPGEGKKFINSQWNSAASTLPQSSSAAPASSAINGMSRKSQYPFKIPGGAKELVIPVHHESSALSPGRSNGIGLASNSNLSFCPRNSIASDYETSSKCRFPAGLNSIDRVKKRYSLPNTQNIDINIDHLHSKDRFTRSPIVGTALELGTDVPVNAHLQRDDHPKKAPIFITPLKDIAVMNAQSARFECIVQCHPQPNVAWSKNGYELQNSSKHVVEYRNGVCRLTLPQAYLDDAGGYSCTATNALGTATTSAQLLVTGSNRSALRY